MLEINVSMTFPDFQRQMEWCQSYFRKMSLKARILINQQIYVTGNRFDVTLRILNPEILFK